LAFNVEYQLQVLRCKTRALTEAEREAVAADKSIDEKYPRPSPEEIKALLDKITAASEDDDSGMSEAEKEAVSDLD
jgi:hypothetical protein